MHMLTAAAVAIENGTSLQGKKSTEIQPRSLAGGHAGWQVSRPAGPRGSFLPEQ